MYKRIKKFFSSVFVKKNRKFLKILKEKLFYKFVSKHCCDKEKYLNGWRMFFKAFRFAFACVVLTAFLIILVLGANFFEQNEDLQDFRYYDNIIWPVVMQDPLPFSEKSPPDFNVIINASIWSAAMENKFNRDKFNEDGMLVLSRKEVQDAAKKLFGENIVFPNFECCNGYFYKYNSSKKEFTVAAVSGVGGYIPHTVKAFQRNNDIFLNVGYISPKNQFNSEMNKVDKCKIEKFARYKLKKNTSTGEFYVSEVM